MVIGRDAQPRAASVAARLTRAEAASAILSRAPAIVRRLLREWRFDDALPAIAAAAEVATRLTTVTAAMAPEDAAAAWARFEDAGSLKALRGVAPG